MENDKVEYFPVIDEDGNVIDRATRQQCHSGSKLLHAAVHLHVFNSKGELYLQKRADWKDIQPGKWDTAVGGHIDFGESVEMAILREASEELGLTNIKPERLFNYIWESPVEREMIYVHTITQDEEPHPDHSEVVDGRFWTISEIEDNIGKGVFTPNFELDFSKLKSVGKIAKNGK